MAMNPNMASSEVDPPSMAEVYSLDLTSCVLKSCEPPISATAGLGTNTQALHLDVFGDVFFWMVNLPPLTCPPQK